MFVPEGALVGSPDLPNEVLTPNWLECCQSSWLPLGEPWVQPAGPLSKLLAYQVVRTPT